jgi:hypothetical protein
LVRINRPAGRTERAAPQRANTASVVPSAGFSSIEVMNHLNDPHPQSFSPAAFVVVTTGKTPITGVLNRSPADSQMNFGLRTGLYVVYVRCDRGHYPHFRVIGVTHVSVCNIQFVSIVVGDKPTSSTTRPTHGGFAA